MDRIKDLIARVKYNVQGFKLAPYALMYKDDAEMGYKTIERLQAENASLKDQCQIQAAQLRIQAEQIHAQNAHINRLMEIVAK